jgi:hypothetical protein
VTPPTSPTPQPPRVRLRPSWPDGAASVLDAQQRSTWPTWLAGLLPEQRTVNPPMVPARYTFLYASSRPALRAPPAALGRQTAMGGLCALQTLGYSPGHGITIAARTPMAQVHPAPQPPGPGGSLLRDALSAQLCLPDLWRPRCDLGARPPRRLAHEDRRVTLCRASSRRLANEAGDHRGRASPSGRAGDPHWRAPSKVVPPATSPPSHSSHPGPPQGGSRAVDGLPGDGR